MNYISGLESVVNLNAREMFFLKYSNVEGVKDCLYKVKIDANEVILGGHYYLHGSGDKIEDMTENAYWGVWMKEATITHPDTLLDFKNKVLTVNGSYAEINEKRAKLLMKMGLV